MLGGKCNNKRKNGKVRKNYYPKTPNQDPGGEYSTLSWVRMCGPKFRTPPYNKTREDANLLPISKPFVS